MSYSRKDIIYIGLGALLFFITISYCANDKLISDFYVKNYFAINLFGVAFVLLSIITGLIYQKSLQDYDEISERTSSSSLICIIIWAFFWVAWGCFNYNIWNSNNDNNLKILFFSFLLNSTPSLVVIMVAVSIRKEELISYELVGKQLLGKFKCFRWYYYSGFYSLLAIFLYLILIVYKWVH